MTDSTGSGDVAAFFDVDETLLACKSMLRFLEFFLKSQGEPTATYQRLTRELASRVHAGVPREKVNRAYYRLFADESAERLAELGRTWLAAEANLGGLLLPEPIADLARHRIGHTPVHLVSGSFFACLDPLAEALGVSGAHGTPVVIRRGRLTGEVTVPMIGRAKADKVRSLMSASSIPPRHCFAYADHASDLPMLQLVGHPVVVGDDPVLTAAAHDRGWRHLRGIPTPTAPAGDSHAPHTHDPR
ncbi:haloacid dehalogenase-like hydrolase (plasmid) [Streptomyces sp. YIM 121038]|uniref:HAD family hydrolase n=1 Tax=Streptomyces sp. YIM 121038 TaxID=2136401 RepID=UPI001110A02E|nr:HAD-IB family hydrolase [Streptomyces sp. YIM 121038]QCX82943.1 haloacid dehalogenase-like hydrolase [Streptomyces sp. YIM 121038]